MLKTVASLSLLVFAVAVPCSGADLDLLLETTPPGAQVEHAGQVLGQTPLRLWYPKGYFETRGTVWGAYLGAPLEFTLSLPGYEQKVVKLGNGPYPWRNALGQILYQHYLLDRSYRIALTPVQPAAASHDAVGQLERLAELKARGALTEEEFAAAKAQILAGSVPSASSQPPTEGNYLDQTDARTLCLRLLDRGFLEATLAKPTGSNRQVLTAADGSDREVMITCAWQLLAPRRAALSVSVTCGNQDPAAKCRSAGEPVAEGKALCLWGTAASARAAVMPACLMEAGLQEDGRSIPGANPVSALDVRDVLRVMVGRL